MKFGMRKGKSGFFTIVVLLMCFVVVIGLAACNKSPSSESAPSSSAPAPSSSEPTPEPTQEEQPPSEEQPDANATQDEEQAEPLALEVAVGTNYELGGSNTGTGAVSLPQLSAGTIGDNGLYYYAASGSGGSVELTPMTLEDSADYGGSYWSYVSESGRKAIIAPLMYDGIGVADPADDKYPVFGLKAPATGNIFVNFNATAYPVEGSESFTFLLTHNGFAEENTLQPDENHQYRIPVTKDDMLYFVFKTNGKSLEGDRVGYYAYFAYTEIQ